jgi:hypothetical protein
MEWALFSLWKINGIAKGAIGEPWNNAWNGGRRLGNLPALRRLATVKTR